MKATFLFETTTMQRHVIIDAFMNFDPEEESYPQPSFKRLEPGRWEYISASGKGKWTISLLHRKFVGIIFEGRRNSFLAANSLFGAPKVSPGIAAKDLTSGNLSICLPGQAYLNLINGHLEVESSTPDVPLWDYPVHEESYTIDDDTFLPLNRETLHWQLREHHAASIFKGLSENKNLTRNEVREKFGIEKTFAPEDKTELLIKPVSYSTEDGECLIPFGLETLRRIGYPKTDPDSH